MTRTTAASASKNNFLTVVLPPDISTATDERNGLLFGSLQIAHERIFVLGEIGVGPGNFPVQQTFFDFADEKCQLISGQRFDPLLVKFLCGANRVRIGET